MFVKGYVYQHKQDIGEEVIDTWGVVLAKPDGSCVLCPDVSVEREQAAEFARLAVCNELTEDNLEEAVCAYIESLSCIF
ncbi:MAG: hypothetical protein IKM24_01875 [Clostridia bacterium]|nr:hypothetical protein [Clostridia bacterium]